jgi:hypothetical protein
LWVTFFLRCLKKPKDNLAQKLERERVLARSLPPLSLSVISLLRDHERLTGANRNTLKVRLRELVEYRHIHRHGKGKATWYTLSPGAPQGVGTPE